MLVNIDNNIQSLVRKISFLSILIMSIVQSFSAEAQAETLDTININSVEMKHYKSEEWNFELNIPKSWSVFPPNPKNSPFEVARFRKQGSESNVLIIFRAPYDPKVPLSEIVDKTQMGLAKGNYGNFLKATSTVGSNEVATLNFDKVKEDGVLWNFRGFFLVNGTLIYTLGFGTSDGDSMFELFDKIAKSFVMLPE